MEISMHYEMAFTGKADAGMGRKITYVYTLKGGFYEKKFKKSAGTLAGSGDDRRNGRLREQSCGRQYRKK